MDPGKKRIKSIETILYLCPNCNRIGTIKSNSKRFFCDCGLEGIYSKEGLIKGDSLQFSNIADWCKWQAGQLPVIIGKAGYDPICADHNQQLFMYNQANKKVLAGEGVMYIDHTVFHCAGFNFPLANILEFTTAGQQMLLFKLLDGKTYEVHSKHPMSTLKYKDIFRALTGE